MKHITRLLAALLLLTLLCACGAAPKSQLEQTADYLQQKLPEPTVSSVGGEWTVFGLTRSGLSVPQSYLDTYYRNLESVVREKNGVLSDRKYTEYSRVVLTLTAMGKDPTQVAGYDLLAPLSEFEQVKKQGINGVIFALLALDSAGYESETRQRYVEELINRQLTSGGWALTGDEADIDVTAMALQALAKYRSDPDLQAAVERGVEVLSQMQDHDGGYTSWGSDNSESVAQVIVAITELGLSPEDPRFVKDGHTLEEALLGFAQKNGAFVHESGADDDLMATEQAFYALAALERAQNGQTTLYDMTDVMQ